jgi:hypothetical protein
MSNPDVADIETVCALIADWLRGGAFQQALAAVQGAYADGLVIDTVLPDNIHAGETFITEQSPHCEVHPLRTLYDLESDSKDATHEVAILWDVIGGEVSGADASAELTLGRVVQRLVRATRDCLWHSTLDGHVAPILVVSEDYGNLAPSPNLLRKGAVTELRVKTFSL